MRYVWAVCIAVCFPITAHAQVLITEIMYAPEGADAKHEWIEVCNTGTSSVSLEDWTFFENDTNHTLKVVSGSATLSAGACAVIADHPDTFTSDYRSYAGTLFDSAFSLKNTGEYLALHDNTEALIDEVGYSDADGGKDNGLSLHRDGIIFQEGVPSPGAYGSGGIVTESNAEKNEGILSDHVTLYSYESVLIEPPEDVYIRMPDTIITTAGAITPFTIESFEATGRVVKDGYIHWSFGDGAEGYGREVSHQYLYEGTYTVSVTLERDTLFDTKRVVVHVVPFDAFMYVDPDGAWVGIRNNSTYDLDISEWRIMSLGQYFRIPRTTIIAAESEVRFPTVITKLSTLSMTKEAQLVFPDGKIALVGKVVQVEEEPIALVATTTEEYKKSEDVETVVAEVSLLEPVVMNTTSVIGTSVPIQEPSVTEADVVNTMTIEDDKVVYATATKASLAAAVVAVDSSESTDIYWYLMLAGLLSIAALGIVMFRQRKTIVHGFEVVDGDT